MELSWRAIRIQRLKKWVLLLPNLPLPRSERTIYKTGFKTEENLREYCSIPLVVTKELLTPLGPKGNVSIRNKIEIIGWRIPNGDFFLKWVGLQQARQVNSKIFWNELLDCGNYNCIRIYHFCVQDLSSKTMVSLSFQLTEDTQFMNFNVLFSVLSWVLFLNLYLKSYLK